jgi:RHS repeat-associated protein
LIDARARRHRLKRGRLETRTGIVHFRYRDYSTSLKTWMQPEPFGGAYIDGENLYNGFRNNPVKYVDPMGLQKMTCFFTGVTQYLGDWEFAGYSPATPAGPNTKAGRAPVGITTVYLRANYVRYFRALFLCIDACNAGPFWRWGPVQQQTGYVDDQNPARTVEAVSIPGGLTFAPGANPNWPDKPKSPQMGGTISPLPAPQLPPGYGPTTTLKPKLPPSKPLRVPGGSITLPLPAFPPPPARL